MIDALLRVHEEMHAACRVEVLAEASDDLLAALRDREGADNTRLAMLAPEVHQLRARRVADLALYAHIIGAQDKHAGLSVHPSRQERVPRDVRTDALLNAAEADVTLLEPTPMGGSDRLVMLDGSDDGIRRIGMNRRSFGGTSTRGRERARCHPAGRERGSRLSRALGGPPIQLPHPAPYSLHSRHAAVLGPSRPWL